VLSEGDKKMNTWEHKDYSNVENVLAHGKGLPTTNPFHIYYKWGQAMVEIQPYGDKSGNPPPRFYRNPKKIKIKNT